MARVMRLGELSAFDPLSALCPAACAGRSSFQCVFFALKPSIAGACVQEKGLLCESRSC